MEFLSRNIGRNLLVGTFLGLIMELSDGKELLKFISWNLHSPKVPKQFWNLPCTLSEAIQIFKKNFKKPYFEQVMMKFDDFYSEYVQIFHNFTHDIGLVK